MRKILIFLGFAVLSVLAGCAVVPAYGPSPYYEPPHYYRPRPYYGPPMLIVPGPVFIPHDEHHGWRH